MIISRVDSLIFIERLYIVISNPSTYYTFLASILLKIRVIALLGSLYTDWIISSLPGYLLISWTISITILPISSSFSISYIIRISYILF
jgi:hypothetical protein